MYSLVVIVIVDVVDVVVVVVLIGSYTSLPCPPGTYSNTSGAINHYDCFDCDPGFYCSNARTPSKMK